MEASLIKLSEMLRQKSAEVEALKRTINAECEERVRLLSLLQQQHPPQPHGPAATLQRSPSAPRSAPAADPAASAYIGGVSAKYVRNKPGMSNSRRR